MEEMQACGAACCAVLCGEREQLDRGRDAQLSGRRAHEAVAVYRASATRDTSASCAHGWPASREAEFVKARSDFPDVRY